MPERNAGRKAGTEEGSGAPALRSKDRESPTAGQATQRAQTALAMAEKTKAETQPWNEIVLQDASVSELCQGGGSVRPTDLSYHRISPPGLQVEWKWGGRALSPQCWWSEGNSLRSQETSEITSHPYPTPDSKLLKGGDAPVNDRGQCFPSDIPSQC